MQIKFASVTVEYQAKALAFYTGALGFEMVTDLPVGEFRWLTVASPEGIAGVELVLEPGAFPPAQVYQKALFEAGIPALLLTSRDLAADFARLTARGVRFRGEPTRMGPVTVAIFEDTCGNLVQLVQTEA
jgi:catechol 2,3-dioxygenase-like lactoylglutathione lyase family enzyme